jgi:bifunctional non-homologous end joining protein LigD
MTHVPGAPLQPMLATTGELPAGQDWVFEFKWDGVRAVAITGRKGPRLWARSGVEITVAYPELAAFRDDRELLLDGELVALDRAGRPSFPAVAERMHVRQASRAAQLAATVPVTFMIFDLLRIEGLDLTPLPYRERRAALESLALGGPHWLVPPSFADGGATEAAARENKLEGVVAKRLSSVYRPGTRSPDWIKWKVEQTEDLIVGGWRPGVRRLGGLLVGRPQRDGRLRFAGRVGGGISGPSERALLAALAPLHAPTSPFAETLPREDAKDANWVRPELVVEVKYAQVTPDGRLRFPRFVALRPDKTARECLPEGGDDG